MDFGGRLDAIVQAMAADGLDLLIGFSNAIHHIEKSDPVATLAGIRPLGESAALLDGDGRVSLVVTPAWDAERAAERSRGADTIGADDLAEAVADQVRGRGTPAGRIGIVGLHTMAHRTEARIRSGLGEGVRAADKLLFAAAGRKTTEDLANARRATAIAEQGYKRLLEIARPGMREYQLAAELKACMKELGADDNFLMLNAAPHNQAVMPSGARALAAGDVILAEITPSVAGQFSQICRSVSIGEPAGVLEAKYRLVVDAMQNGIAAAVPDAPMADVCQAINDVLEAEGYGEYCHPPYIRRRGHGLGIGSVVPGDVSLDNRTTLEEDMFFVVHPNQYLPESGYLLCGEPIRVTPDGGAPMTETMAALGVVEA